MKRPVLAVLAAAAAAAYLLGLAAQAPALRLAAKPVPVACLALLAWSAGTRYGRLIAAGLGWSLLGDVLLELDGWFVPGLAAFLAAHLTYVAAFLSESRQPAALRAVPFALFGLGFYVFLRPGLDGLHVPVAAYAAALASMMWRASACVGATARGRRAEWVALAGAVLFGASDSLIGLDRFHAPISGVRYAVILTYWLGQLGIALSASPASRQSGRPSSSPSTTRGAGAHF